MSGPGVVQLFMPETHWMLVPPLLQWHYFCSGIYEFVDLSDGGCRDRSRAVLRSASISFDGTFSVNWGSWIWGCSSATIFSLRSVDKAVLTDTQLLHLTVLVASLF